jgi:hypothetical protein
MLINDKYMAEAPMLEEHDRSGQRWLDKAFLVVSLACRAEIGADRAR